MNIWTKKEATARALEMHLYYIKTNYNGYRYERDKWLEIARKADKIIKVCGGYRIMTAAKYSVWKKQK